MADVKTRTALVLQGGGAYGAYELGAFQAIWEKGIRPDVVTGVSIGAINAAVVVGCKNDDPPAALAELWERLTVMPMPGLPDWLHHLLSVHHNPGMHAINPEMFLSPFTITSYSNTDLLKKTLNDLINWDKLNAGDTRLAVTALNIGTGRVTVFRNHAEPGARPQDIGVPLRAEHILASGALPPAFPMIPIGDGSFWDGGLSNNTPLKPAFKAIQSIDDPEGAEIRRRIIVLALFPPGGALPENLVEVETRKTDIAFACKIDFDRELYHKISAFREFAQLVARECPDNEKINRNEGFKKLMSYKTIHELLRIDLDARESVLDQKLLPGANFTRKTIQERSRRGYEITKRALS